MLFPFIIVALVLFLLDGSSDAARIRGRNGRRWQQIQNNSADSVNQQIEAQQISAEHEHEFDHHRDERREEEDDPMLLEMANNSKAENQMKDSAKLKVKQKAMNIGAHAEDDPPIEHNRDPMLEEAERRHMQVQVLNWRQKSAIIIEDDDAIGETSKASSGHDGIQQEKDDPMLLEVENNSKEKEEKQQNVRRNNTNGDGVAIARDPMLDEAERQVQGVVRNSKGQKTGASDHGAIGWHNKTMERVDPMEVENNSKSEEYERQQQKARRNVAHAEFVSVSVADAHHYHDEHQRDPMLEEAERRPVVVYRRRQKSGITIIESTNEANVNASDDAIVGGSNDGANNNNQDQGMMAAVFDSSMSSSSPLINKHKKIVVDTERGEESAIAHDIVLQQQQPQQQALFRQPGAPLKKRKHHPALMTTSVYQREAGSTEKKRYKAARKNPEPPQSSSSSSYHDYAMDDSDSGEEAEAASAESQQSTSIESLANDDDVGGEEAEAAAQKERQNPQERKKFTEANVRILQESFNKQKYLEDAEWLRLRKETGLRLKQIGDWFKNARQRKAKNMAADEQVERRDYDKTNFTESQLRTLTDAFNKHQDHIENDDEEWIRLSQELGVRLQVIANWFHNARQKAKDGATKKWEYKQKNKCVLQASFDKQNYLEDAEWLRLRKETGLRLKQIGDWFKNARQQSKAKNSSAVDEQTFLNIKNFRKQTKFTEAQKRTLRKSFVKLNYLEDEEWIRLSQATGLRLKMIEDCFHNARYKQKPELRTSADEQEGTAKKRKSKAARKNTKSPAVKRNKTGTSDIAKTSHQKGRKKRRRVD